MDIQEFTAARRTVETRLGPIAYTEIGEGPAALFVHGVLVNGLLWRHPMAQLSDVRRCIAIDLPAHGGTPAMPDLSLEGLADAVAALCEALDLDRVDLVGNDTGGAVCQVFAARHPERVRSLTLTNCDVHDRLPPAAFEPALELAAKGQFAPVVETLFRNDEAARSLAGFGGVYEHPERLDAELIRAFLEPVGGTPERARELERLLVSIDRDALVSIEDRLRALRAPALLVWGDGDVFFTMDDARRLASILGDVRELVVVPGAKLFFPDERPGDLVPHVRRHWAAVDVALPA